PVGRRSVVSIVPAILHPFPDIAEHVPQTKWVRRERSDRSRLLVVPGGAASLAIGVGASDLVAPPIGRRGPCASRIFPFRFGEQPIGPGGQARDPSGILLGILPAYVDDWVSLSGSVL